MRLAHTKKVRRLIVDTCGVGVSIYLAFLISNTGFVHMLTDGLRSIDLLGSFLAGMMFTSMFTTAPAIAVLGELAQEMSVVTVAFHGALGAVVGDWLVLTFLRGRVAEDAAFLFKEAGLATRVRALLKTKLMYWVAPLLGALVIISPIPDEVGLALLGLSRLSGWRLLALLFVLNFGGIAAIGFVARAVGW